jgi:hypothetical protein
VQLQASQERIHSVELLVILLIVSKGYILILHRLMKIVKNPRQLALQYPYFRWTAEDIRRNNASFAVPRLKETQRTVPNVCHSFVSLFDRPSNPFFSY